MSVCLCVCLCCCTVIIMSHNLQAAYLVGIADPSSSSATPGIVDQSQFARANQAISMACQSLLNPNSSQQQVS